MNTLVKKLNFVGTITSNNYDLGWDIYDLVVEDKCEIVSIKPSDDFYYHGHGLNIKKQEDSKKATLSTDKASSCCFANTNPR